MHSKYDNMHKNGMFYALISLLIIFLHIKIAFYHLHNLMIKGRGKYGCLESRRELDEETYVFTAMIRGRGIETHEGKEMGR